MLEFDVDHSQSDIEEYMSRNGITDLLSVGSSTSSSGTTTSPSSNEFNYSSDNIHSEQNKVKCTASHTWIFVRLQASFTAREKYPSALLPSVSLNVRIWIPVQYFILACINIYFNVYKTQFVWNAWFLAFFVVFLETEINLG
jgi:hypothetical protein